MNNLPQRIFNGNGLPKINGGQQALFLLVCKCLKHSRKVEYEEIMGIYTSVVQRSCNKSDGYWDKEKNCWGWNSRRYDPWEIDILAQSWLLRALGALIKKGYLTVVPCIEFSKVLAPSQQEAT